MSVEVLECQREKNAGRRRPSCRATRWGLASGWVGMLALLVVPAWAQQAASSALVGAASSAALVVDNPYGLSALWAGSDWVAKAVLLIMAVMSMGRVRRGRQGRRLRVMQESHDVVKLLLLLLL